MFGFSEWDLKPNGGPQTEWGTSRSAPRPGTSHSEPGQVRSLTPTSTRPPSPGSGQTFIPEAQPLRAPHPEPELESSSPRSTPGLRPHFRLWVSRGQTHAPTSVFTRPRSPPARGASPAAPTSFPAPRLAPGASQFGHPGPPIRTHRAGSGV